MMATAEEYLCEIELMNIEINDRWEDLQRLYAMRTKMTTVFSLTPVAGSGNKSKIEDMTIKIREVEIELNQKIDAFVDYKKEVMALIYRLKNKKFYTVLKLMYFKYMSVEDIAYEMGCSEKTVRNILNEALQAVDVLLKGIGGEKCV